MKYREPVVGIRCSIGDDFVVRLYDESRNHCHVWDKEWFPVTENIHVIAINGAFPNLVLHAIEVLNNSIKIVFINVPKVTYGI